MTRAALFIALALLPLSAQAQFGPIVPEACRQCPCGFGGVLAIIQNLVNFAIGIAIIFATIILVWGGILYVLSPTNPENRGTANKMLINAVVGLLITLSAWLIVDFVMKTLYGGQFGPWNTILLNGSGPSCIESKDNKSLFDGNITATPGAEVDDRVVTGTGANCPAADESTMVAFPAAAVAGGSGKATQATVTNFMAMRAAAARDNIDLKVTSAYRSEASQVSLWNRRSEIGAVARPCSLGGNGSNHNSGEAVDIDVGCSNGNSSCNTRTYNWLKNNGHRWNFRNTLRDDPVHWSPSGR
ncbi:MAG TPA: D-alanyl-D-alanine carboxypeptidase family protein [Candidatus Paceibacterota bacterium]